jgi:acetyltransferase-like isoleucine patch superfamily enzyme
MAKIKKVIKNCLRMVFPSLVKQIEFQGLRLVILYWFFQRVVGINSHVPWSVHWTSVVVHPEKIVIKGEKTAPGWGPGQYIQANNGIIFGSNVLMGPGLKIISADHGLNDFDVHPTTEPIEIGDNCWLAANVIILPGVKLGAHVIVAAGSIVTKSFPNDCLIAGIPAQIKKRLSPYGTLPKQDELEKLKDDSASNSNS